MGRAKPPGYRLHKPSGQAFVEIRYKRHYLGKYGSPESREAYTRKLAEFSVSESIGIVPKNPRVNVLVSAFWEQVKKRYVKNGRPTSEVVQFRRALRPLKELYRDLPTGEFSPKCLLAIRETYRQAGHCRNTINVHTGRIVRCFKWGVSRELVPVAVWQSLLSVEGLRKGEAPDHSPVMPIADELIDAVRPHVSRHVWALIQFQRFTGCRPHEACIIRGRDVDRTGDVWIYRPRSHKTEHHERHRVILIGPRAREVLTPWLRENPDEYLFQPREARNEFMVAVRAARKTPRYPSDPVRKKRHPKKLPGLHYTASSYHRTIRTGCELAFKMPQELRKIPKDAENPEELRRLAIAWRAANCWSPNRLRHTAATKIRAAYGIEAARIILGHSSAVTSEIYAEKDLESAKAIMGQLG